MTKVNVLEKMSNMKFNRPLWSFSFFLISISSQNFAREGVFNGKHQFTFSYRNCIYSSQKITPQYGILKFIPTTKYSYDLGIDYSYYFYKNIGFQIGLHQGFIPTDYYDNSEKIISEETFKGYGFQTIPLNSIKYNHLSVFYFDFPISLTSSFKLNKSFQIMARIGASFKVYYNYREESFSTYQKKDVLGYNRTQLAKYHILETNKSYATFFPDLLLGLDFLISPKSNRHNFVLSLVYNKGFVQRFTGYYEYQNLGQQFDSRGLISYGSDYFGIGIGYSFFTKNKASKNANYLFNNRF